MARIQNLIINNVSKQRGFLKLSAGVGCHVMILNSFSYDTPEMLLAFSQNQQANKQTKTKTKHFEFFCRFIQDHKILIQSKCLCVSEWLNNPKCTQCCLALERKQLISSDGLGLATPVLCCQKPHPRYQE